MIAHCYRSLGFLAFGLLVIAAAPPTWAAEPPAHQHASAEGLTLNEGKKWATDEALRQGMAKMRSAVGFAVSEMHRAAFPEQAYAALADRLQEQVDFVVGNCKLPEAADEQLHIVLEQILEGINALRSPSEHLRGAMMVAEALDSYGRFFEHPGWMPVVAGSSAR